MDPLGAFPLRSEEDFESVWLEVCELVICDHRILTFVALLPDPVLCRVDPNELLEDVASDAGCAPLETPTVDLEEVCRCAAEQDESRTLGVVGTNCLIRPKSFEVSVGQPLKHDVISGVIRPGKFRDVPTCREAKVSRNLGYAELKVLTSDLNGIHDVSPSRFSGIVEPKMLSRWESDLSYCANFRCFVKYGDLTQIRCLILGGQGSKVSEGRRGVGLVGTDGLVTGVGRDFRRSCAVRGKPWPLRLCEAAFYCESSRLGEGYAGEGGGGEASAAVLLPLLGGEGLEREGVDAFVAELVLERVIDHLVLVDEALAGKGVVDDHYLVVVSPARQVLDDGDRAAREDLPQRTFDFFWLDHGFGISTRAGRWTSGGGRAARGFLRPARRPPLSLVVQAWGS